MIHAVVGILKRDNKVLVGQRPPGKPYSGYWEFPGGKVEQNESIQSALTRELHEELGIDVTSASPWFTHQHTYPDKVVLLDMWVVSAFNGEPHGKEKQILRWVSYDEILQLRLLEGNWPIIDKLKMMLEM